MLDATKYVPGASVKIGLQFTSTHDTCCWMSMIFYES